MDSTLKKLVESCPQSCLKAPVLQWVLLIPAVHKSCQPHPGAAGCGSCQTLLQKKGPQVSAGHTRSTVGCVLPQAQPLQVPWDSHSSMGEMSGLAWWGWHGVHKQKPKLPASEMLQDITASISIIISR